MGKYDPLAYPAAAVTVDLVVLTIRQGDLAVLLIRRGVEPYLARLALPGGFVRPDESLGAAAERELREETGLDLGRSQHGRGQQGARRAEQVHLEQLASYGDPGRDPRLHVVTVAYLALAPQLPAPQAGSDAATASWFPAEGLGEKLAFDHGRILADGLERAKAKLEYTPLATAFCPAEFTVGQLRLVYEIVWGTTLDPRNFHRKVTGTRGFLAPTGHTTEGDRGRPAQLYRRGDADVLFPPMLRSAVS
jgi:8-oxo-dGTP diphosphatase